MKILIAGGVGFIGSHIQDKLITLGHEVALVDNLRSGKTANIHPRATFFQIDICTQQDIEQDFNEFRSTAIFHLSIENQLQLVKERGN